MNVLRLDVPEDVPASGSLYDGHYECPECGQPFDADNNEDWEYAHAGDAWGGSATYTCPGCDQQTITVNY